MKWVAWVTVGILLPLLAHPAVGQDVEVLLFRHVDNEPVGKVANELALSGEFDVKVEKPLREKRITLELNGVSPAKALELVAEAAGAHLVKTGAKSYEIRSAPEGEAAPAGEAKAEAKLPDWAVPLAKKMAETELEAMWQGERLPAVLEWLSGKTGVRIRLDPRVVKERPKTAIEIHIAQYDEGLNPSPIEASAARLLGMVLSYPGLDCSWCWRYGGIFVSTRKHIESLPPIRLAPAPSEEEDLVPEVREKIESTRVTVSLKKASLKKAVDTVAKKAGVKISVPSKLAREFRSARIELDIEDMPLLDALDLVLGPHGLVLAIEKGQLSVSRAKK
jgi:hypothetical protein